MTSLKYRLAGWLFFPAVLFAPLMWTHPVLIFGNSDALFYSNILDFISSAMRSGDFYPRWFAQANAGFGSPVMLFYAPLAYSITAFITLPLSQLHMDISLQMLIGMYASQVASAITAWMWLRNKFSLRIAYAGSLLFVMLPYKLIYIYLHINLAQLWALAFLPVWMMAAERMVAEGKRAVALYALALALVYYTHPLTVLAFGAVPACYVLWFGRRCAFGNYAKLACAHMLAIGLCLAQALPQYAYLEWIHAEDFLTGRHDWQQNLFHVDAVLCAYYGIIAALVSYAIYKLRELEDNLKDNPVCKAALFWAVVIGVIAFMTQKPSMFLWQHITPLHYLQFPAARLHASALMGTVYLLCVWLAFTDKFLPLGPFAYRRSAMAALIAVFACATALHIYNIYSDPKNFNREYVQDGREARLLTPLEYKTRWGCVDPAQAITLYRQNRIPADISVTEGQAEITDLSWNPPSRIRFNIHVRSAQAYVTFRQCYIPLWQGRDEHANALPLFADARGLIGMDFSKGQHAIEVGLFASFIQRTGEWCTLLTLCLCIILLL